MMNIATIMSTVVPNTFVPDMNASEAPTVSAIPVSAAPVANAAPIGSEPPGAALGALPGLREIPAETPSPSGASVAPSVRGDTSFKDTVKQMLSDVNDSINTSDQNTRDLAAGKTNDVNKVVTSVEEANLALQYTMAIRTKLLEAYTSVQQMTV